MDKDPWELDIWIYSSFYGVLCFVAKKSVASDSVTSNCYGFMLTFAVLLCHHQLDPYGWDHPPMACHLWATLPQAVAHQLDQPQNLFHIFNTQAMHSLRTMDLSNKSMPLSTGFLPLQHSLSIEWTGWLFLHPDCCMIVDSLQFWSIWKPLFLYTLLLTWFTFSISICQFIW